MRILLDQAGYDEWNIGNVALLQSAIYKLLRLWPEATFYVITLAPHLLKYYYPNVISVAVFSWQTYMRENHPNHLFTQFVSRSFLRLTLELEEELWHQFPHYFPVDLGDQLGKY